MKPHARRGIWALALSALFWAALFWVLDPGDESMVTAVMVAIALPGVWAAIVAFGVFDGAFFHILGIAANGIVYWLILTLALLMSRIASARRKPNAIRHVGHG